MKRVVYFVLIALSLVACKKEMLFPNASGRPYEVLVVMDDAMWEKRPVGRALFAVLDTDVPGLPQSERSFAISQCETSDLDRAFKLFRTVLTVDINPSIYTKATLKFTRNKYAMGQIWVTFQAPSEEVLTQFFKDNRQFIVDFITKTEMNRTIKEFKEKHSAIVADLAKQIFGCEMWAPDEIQSYKKGQQFLWASNNSASGLLNVCLYSYPYEGPETFNKPYVLHKRDSIMKVNLPGSEPDNYVQTDTLYTDCKPTVVHGKFAYESRGLWYMENAGMGGPFVSISRVDTTRNLVMVAEAFVYAPERMKRGMLRRVEASLYTLMLPHETTSKPEADTGGEEEKK